jgi:leader peptidase (prepilin peptidase)/N-methyltransferase
VVHFALAYGLFGLIIGSFLNVCIYRLPRRESILFPGSHCPKCGKSVRPYDNIPVVSYLLLGGKCRFCRSPISIQYPSVELATGLCFFACAHQWNTASPTFLNSAFLAVLIVLVFIDYHHQILPNVLTIPGAVLGIILSPLQDEVYYDDLLTRWLVDSLSQGSPQLLQSWVGAFLGALAGAGTLYLVAFLYKAARNKQGLGMGDVKMMAMVGAVLGWRLAFLTIFVGSALGSLIGVVLIVFKGRNLQYKLAFGTFLGIASAVALFYGLPLIRWYLGLTS